MLTKRFVCVFVFAYDLHVALAPSLSLSVSLSPSLVVSSTLSLSLSIPLARSLALCKDASMPHAR